MAVVEGGVSVVQTFEELVVAASVRAAESGALKAGSVVKGMRERIAGLKL